MHGHSFLPFPSVSLPPTPPSPSVSSHPVYQGHCPPFLPLAYCSLHPFTPTPFLSWSPPPNVHMPLISWSLPPFPPTSPTPSLPSSHCLRHLVTPLPFFPLVFSACSLPFSTASVTWSLTSHSSHSCLCLPVTPLSPAHSIPFFLFSSSPAQSLLFLPLPFSGSHLSHFLCHLVPFLSPHTPFTPDHFLPFILLPSFPAHSIPFLPFPSSHGHFSPILTTSSLYLYFPPVLVTSFSSSHSLHHLVMPSFSYSLASSHFFRIDLILPSYPDHSLHFLALLSSPGHSLPYIPVLPLSTPLSSHSLGHFPLPLLLVTPSHRDLHLMVFTVAWPTVFARYHICTRSFLFSLSSERHRAGSRPKACVLF